MNFQIINRIKGFVFRHCERSEAIQNTNFFWIASGYRPRNDGVTNLLRRFNKILLFTFVILLSACTNSSRPGLSDKQLLSLESPERDETERIVNFSDTIPSGVKYSEERAIDVAAPPVTLDLHSQNIESKNFDPADYYSKVSFVKIKHPRAEVGGKFTNTRGISLLSNQNLVQLSDKYIFLSDLRLGLFCYDAQGNFLDTIVSEGLSKDKTQTGSSSDGKERVIIYTADVAGYLGAFSVFGDDCMFLTVEGEMGMMNFYNIPTKTRSADIEKDVQKLNFQNFSPVTVPPKRPFESNVFRGGGCGVPVLISQSSYIIETLSPVNMEETFLTTFGIWGDTLCHFQDHVPKIKVQTTYASADCDFSYLLNNQYTVRQQYNDTVFRLTANNRLTPVYILDFGEKRLDKRSGLIGDKSGKLMLGGWLENNQFIYIISTENYDCPNTRQKDEVKFFYRFYHKRDKKLYQIPVKDTYPEDVIIGNSLPNGIPFTLDKINVLNNMLYVVYSKTDLQKLMEHPSFSALPENQKERVKQHYDGMNDDELLIMKMEN